jgi:hypothetical protein
LGSASFGAGIDPIGATAEAAFSDGGFSRQTPSPQQNFATIEPHDFAPSTNTTPNNRYGAVDSGLLSQGFTPNPPAIDLGPTPEETVTPSVPAPETPTKPGFRSEADSGDIPADAAPAPQTSPPVDVSTDISDRDFASGLLGNTDQSAIGNIGNFDPVSGMNSAVGALAAIGLNTEPAMDPRAQDVQAATMQGMPPSRRAAPVPAPTPVVPNPYGSYETQQNAEFGNIQSQLGAMANGVPGSFAGVPAGDMGYALNLGSERYGTAYRDAIARDMEAASGTAIPNTSLRLRDALSGGVPTFGPGGWDIGGVAVDPGSMSVPSSGSGGLFGDLGNLGGTVGSLGGLLGSIFGGPGPSDYGDTSYTNSSGQNINGTPSTGGGLLGGIFNASPVGTAYNGIGGLLGGIFGRFAWGRWW